MPECRWVAGKSERGEERREMKSGREREREEGREEVRGERGEG